ncbi:MAG TPA: Holliday junction branch migration protein RuvA [Patescibacteria group bacterium]|nr:Holliday junction branch migration protein RuvA [Patescibacteria group bacterium]
MIGFLKGTIEIKQDPYLFINVNGVGYKVYAAGFLLQKVHVGETHTVFTFTYVREDALELFGFEEQADLQIFELLISVSGVGPKTAMGIFSVGDRGQILQAIRSADVGFFTEVPRLGKKNAQKIIIELKNKLGSTEELNLHEEEDDTLMSLLSALESMGFSEREARLAIKQTEGQGESIQEKMKLALKQLGR